LRIFGTERVRGADIAWAGVQQLHQLPGEPVAVTQIIREVSAKKIGNLGSRMSYIRMKRYQGDGGLSRKQLIHQ
jgi:hypothetical protein